MIVTGIICACDGKSMIDCKRYIGRANREKILEYWTYNYDSIIIIPDTEFLIPISGIISLRSNKIRLKSYYHSIEERQIIIDDWIEMYDLKSKEYTLNIIPND